jgi:hypothetical protein
LMMRLVGMPVAFAFRSSTSELQAASWTDKKKLFDVRELCLSPRKNKFQSGFLKTNETSAESYFRFEKWCPRQIQKLFKNRVEA